MLKHIGSLCLAVLMLTAPTAAIAAEFHADVVQVVDGVKSRGAVYVKDGRYRLEFLGADGHRQILLVDPDSGLTRLVQPDMELYREIPSRDMVALVADPIQGLNFMIETHETRSQGRTEIAGQVCEVRTIMLGGEPIEEFCLSEALGFPLSINHLLETGIQFELTAIQQQPVDEGLFDIPEGFTRLEPMAVAAQP
jgi:hypothetical protein